MADKELNLAIGVAAFRSDEAVLNLVANLLEQQVVFKWLIVVESQASGVLERRLAEIVDQRIRYYAEGSNIGSAGNLARRLQIAEELGADWMLAFNHDAPVSAQAISALVSVAAGASPRLGALYPLRFEQGRGQYCMSGRWRFPFGFVGRIYRPAEALTLVCWGSSNGALYSLRPIRDGFGPDASLWMGWEDYLYGLTLERNGWLQWIVRDAEIRDCYEYSKNSLGGIQVILSDKPCWYYYYAVRNQLLIHLYMVPTFLGVAGMVAWIPAYTLRILTFPGRCTRGVALRNIIHGVYDGLRKQSGKWRLP